MKTLEYFQTTTPPHWAIKKFPGLMGWCLQSTMSMQCGQTEILMGNASALILSCPPKTRQVLKRVFVQDKIIPYEEQTHEKEAQPRL